MITTATPGKIARIAAISLSLLLAGCAQKTVVVDPLNDTGPVGFGLDYRDFERAASKSVESMLRSGAVSKPGGGRYVLVISRIINDTMQRIDTDQIIKKVRVALLQSGKVVVTTAVGISGPEDEMVMRARELNESDEFDQNTKIAKGQLVRPDLSLSGKIIQRNLSLDDDTQQVDYYFQLTLTELGSGLAFWENETPIIKRGSNDSVTW